MKRYFLNLFVAVDRLINALTGGDPEMTLSGRMGRAVAEGRCKTCGVVCWVLDKFDANHCARVSKNEADEGSDEVVKL